MAGFVFPGFRLCLCVGLAFGSLVPVPSARAQSGWDEPIQAPREPEPPAPPAEPNPDWGDAPPTEYEERSPQNPDWVEETEAPPVTGARRSASEVYDIRFSNRSLTLPRGMIRGTYDTVAGRRLGTADAVSAMSLGFAISLAQDFEIGFSRYRMGSFPDSSALPSFGFGGEGLIAFSLSPDVKFGDIPLYARFQALDRKAVKLALDAVFRIPSQTNFGFLGGIPIRVIVQERFSFDFGVQFDVVDNPQGPVLWGMNLPFAFNANATDGLFFQLLSGINLFDLGQTLRTATSGLVQGPFYFIPLGVTAGYAFEGGSTMMDAFVSFRFPALYGFTARDSNVNSETWQFIIG